MLLVFEEKNPWPSTVINYERVTIIICFYIARDLYGCILTENSDIVNINTVHQVTTMLATSKKSISRS